MNENKETVQHYAEIQENYYLQYAKLLEKQIHTVNELNKEAHRLIRSGNYKQTRVVRTTLDEDHETKGDGYFEIGTDLPENYGEAYGAYFPMNYHLIQNASHLFRDRVFHAYQKENGIFPVYRKLDFDFERAVEGNFFSANEILSWLEKEKSGLFLKQYFSGWLREQNNHKVTMQFPKWHRSEGALYYSNFNSLELFGLLNLFEKETTFLENAYTDLDSQIDWGVESEWFKIKHPITESSLIDTIRFYQNGKVDVHFYETQQAENFADWTKENLSQKADVSDDE